MTVNGWLVADKPQGLSSTQVVGKVRRHLKLLKVGHIGTLDPLATGVLVIAIGEATKLIPYLPTGPKIYEFVVRWGEARDTDDEEGEIINQSASWPSLVSIKDALCHFIGNLEQIPPLYSAIKNNGQPAYKLARQGKVPPLTPRSITIQDLRIVESLDNKTTRFQVHCGSGTYVRALARDLATYLGTYGYVKELRRLQDGLFSIQDTICVEKILEVRHKSDDYPLIKPVEAVLDDIPAVLLSAVDAQKIRQGLAIDPTSYGFKIQTVGPIALFYESRILAMAELQEGKLQPRRVFNLTLPTKGMTDVD